MAYKKKTSPYYYPNIVELNIGEYTVSVNYTEILDESCVEFYHVHEHYEVYYCLRGTMQLRVGERYETLEPHQFAMIRPGTFHNTVYNPAQEKGYFVFVFEGAMPQKGKQAGKTSAGAMLQKGFDILRGSTGCIYNDQHKCQEIVARLAYEMETHMQGADQMIVLLYSEFLIGIFRTIVAQEVPEKPINMKAEGDINLALELTQYMHNNYSSNIMLNEVAEYFHVSERHVTRVFEKYFGTSFKRTLNVYRINYAKNYLLDTDYSIEKIAELVGIGSVKSFHRLFREIVDMTPTEFREAHRDVEKNEEKSVSEKNE